MNYIRHRHTNTSPMRVKKRNGNIEDLNMSKIKNKLEKLINIHPKLNHVNIKTLLNTLNNSWGEFMTSAEIPNLVSETAAAMTTDHHHYSKLAGRAWVDNLHKETPATFTESMIQVKHLLHEPFLQTIKNYSEQINDMIVHDRDFQYDIFACKTLERSYLVKRDNIIVERPQYLIMRVAIAIAIGRSGDIVSNIRENYDSMSKLLYTHATPTLFHSGMRKQQLASCFLMTMKSDSIAGIYETLKDCALISKGAGGIGISISQIRPTGSQIEGTNGVSNGITPMLKVFNDTARYVDQGGGKRKGSFAVWLEPWHPDVQEFLDLKKNHGDENKRARDLFYGLWVPDLFMKRVKMNGQWSLFCPNKCPGLQDAWGEAFETLYKSYEQKGLAHGVVNARELWLAICDSQMETGTPYLMYKDSVNAKSNQQNLGTIRSSNLCCEVTEYTSPDEVAVCTLASIALPKCMAGKRFEYSRLEKITRLVVKNLNAVIDINTYPIPEAENSNKKHRPIGIGIQGLADVFQMMEIPYDSEEALTINNNIFETIYYAAITESVEQSKEYGPYETFNGSPASKGKLQFDLWGVVPTRYNWDKVKEDVQYYGLRNSLLVAPMPTASTASILGNTESFEPRTSNLYNRRVLAGEYMMINSYLQDKLVAKGLWNETNKKALIANRGSVQKMNIPEDLKKVFKTVWEMSQKALIHLSAGRAPFICQAQSLNLYIQKPTRAVLSSMGFYAWGKGLKTGQYYLRSQPEARAIQFTVKKGMEVEEEEEECLMCSA